MIQGLLENWLLVNAEGSDSASVTLILPVGKTPVRACGRMVAYYHYDRWREEIAARSELAPGASFRQSETRVPPLTPSQIAMGETYWRHRTEARMAFDVAHPRLVLRNATLRVIVPPVLLTKAMTNALSTEFLRHPYLEFDPDDVVFFGLGEEPV